MVIDRLIDKKNFELDELLECPWAMAHRKNYILMNKYKTSDPLSMVREFFIREILKEEQFSAKELAEGRAEFKLLVKSIKASVRKDLREQRLMKTLNWYLAGVVIEQLSMPDDMFEKLESLGTRELIRQIYSNLEKSGS